MKKIFLALIILSVLLFSENYVVVNSKDGRDVLSAVFYANVKDLPVKFLPITGSPDILAAKVGDNKDVLLVESSDLPVSGSLESKLRSGEGNTVTVMKSTDAALFNLELARKSGATKFILVDSAFSDNALSALPYAARINAYVLFTNKANAEEVKNVVQNADELIVLGYVDEEVKQAVAQFNPEYLGTGEDRFEDNIAIVDRFLSEFDVKQVWVVSGSFIEEGMVEGSFPILYSGQLTPKVTYDYLKQSTIDDKIRVYVLVGNELVTPFHDTRERIETELLSEGVDKTYGIIVKFAQAVSDYHATPSGLDMFPLPVYVPSLNISSISYNSATQKLELILDNLGDGPAFFSSEIMAKINGQDYSFLKDEEVLSVARGASYGVSYDFTFPSVDEGTVTVEATTFYGPSRQSLEQFAQYEGALGEIVFTDSSDLEAMSARYDKAGKLLQVTLKNPGTEPVYVSTETELYLQGSSTKIKSDKVVQIAPGSIYVSEIPVELSDEDLAATMQNLEGVQVYATFGSREAFLVKSKVFQLPVQAGQPQGDLLVPILIILAVMVAIAVAAFFFLRRKPFPAQRPKRR